MDIFVLNSIPHKFRAMYTQEITRKHRTAFVIAIDQSQSMQEEVALCGRTISKATAVAKVTDTLINELILRATRDDGVRDYYDIALIGYAGEEVYPLLDPARNFIPVAEFCNYAPISQEVVIERLLPNGEKRAHTEQVLHWIAPRAEGDTPMYEAMLYIHDIVAEWCHKPQNAESFPPVIFNITDGACSDCSERDLLNISERIRNIATADGNVLLINIHLASDSSSRAVIFPSENEIDADNHLFRLLADSSSIMPAAFNEMIRSQRGEFALPPFRAVSYNASMTELITMLNIGSRSITNLL